MQQNLTLDEFPSGIILDPKEKDPKDPDLNIILTKKVLSTCFSSQTPEV